jgi:GTPase SAR1 family protein
MEEAKNQKNDKTVIMLIGAKSDLADKREVIKETVEDFIKEQGITLSFEVRSEPYSDQRQEQYRS